MKRKYFKLNIEDVIDIVTESLAISEGFDTFSTKSGVMSENGNWYLIVAVGEADDLKIGELDIAELGKSIEYNGTHEIEGYWQTDEEIKKAVENFLKNNKNNR